MKRKKVYFITVVIGFAICMVGVIFGSRLVFQRTCERRTTPWSDLGTADDDEYRILIDTDMFLTEYIILAIHLNSQGALSDVVLNKVKKNANLMI